MPRSSRPLGQSEFAVALRALHERAGRPAQQDIGRAVRRTHSTVGLVLRGEYTPPWDIASAIIRALGGDPADFLAAWEASGPKTAKDRPVPVVPALRSLLVRHERLGDDFRAYLTSAAASPLPALPGGRLAEYRLSGAGGRDVSVWHVRAGCTQTAVVHDGGEFLEWVLDHEREAHGDGS
jgi:hypothetical protein